MEMDPTRTSELLNMDQLFNVLINVFINHSYTNTTDPL
jgi:hypothetical protein